MNQLLFQGFTESSIQNLLPLRDIISVQSMLKHEGFEVKEINMNAYMRARALTQEFIDDWLGYFINPGNKHMSSLLLGCGLPGGMMGSMMADLAGIHHVINNTLKAKGEPELSTDDMLVKLFDEVAYVWPRVGYPPLVTPFSQYVKNIALMNLLTLAQGKGRFVMMDEAMWGMILGMELCIQMGISFLFSFAFCLSSFLSYL